MMRLFLGLTCVALLLGPTGCAFQLDPCSSDEDCPRGTTCARPAGTDVPMCIVASEGAADTGSAADTAGAGDDGTAPIPWPDQGNNQAPGPDMGMPAQCPVVTDCGESEPNDSEDNAIYLSEFAEGCGGFGLDPWSAVHQDSLCAGDVDEFSLEYVACDEGAYRLTVSLLTPDMCTAGGNLDIAEGLYDCSDPEVRCEVVGGVERIVILIEHQPYPQPVETIRFAVSAADPDRGLDYILRATIGR